MNLHNSPRIYISAIRYALSNSALTAEEILASMRDNGTPLVAANPEATLATLMLGGYEGRPPIAIFDVATNRYRVLANFRWGSETAIVLGRLMLMTLGVTGGPQELRQQLCLSFVECVRAMYRVADQPHSGRHHQNIKLGVPWVEADDELRVVEAFKAVYRLIQTNVIQDLTADPHIARQFFRLFEESAEFNMTAGAAQARA